METGSLLSSFKLYFWCNWYYFLTRVYQHMKKQLLSISAKAIKFCTRANDVRLISYENLHEMAGRSAPDKLIMYKLSLQLYRTFNQHIPTQDWVNLNCNSINWSRQSKFATRKENKLKVEMNSISNRFFYLNGKIELNWLNITYNSYKVKCKTLFL